MSYRELVSRSISLDASNVQERILDWYETSGKEGKRLIFARFWKWVPAALGMGLFAICCTFSALSDLLLGLIYGIGALFTGCCVKCLRKRALSHLAGSTYAVPFIALGALGLALPEVALRIRRAIPVDKIEGPGWYGCCSRV